MSDLSVKTSSMQTSEIVEAIKVSHSAVIVAHVNPDGDTLGSMLALALLLERYGVQKVHRVMHDTVPEIYKFFPGQENILCSQNSSDLNCLLDEYDISFSCDCGSVARLGSAGDIWSRAKSRINIDHHLSNPLYGDLNMVDSNATCTGQVVNDLRVALMNATYTDKIKSEISILGTDLASLMYITLLTDTGGFRHSNTNSDVFRWAAELVDAGANPNYLYAQLFNNMPTRALKLIGLATSRMQIKKVNDLKLAYAFTSAADLCNLDATDEDTDEIVDHLMRSKDIDGCIYLRQGQDNLNTYKGSLRSKGKFDCSAIASQVNGGGHVRAAGFNLDANNVNDVLDRVLDSFFSS